MSAQLECGSAITSHYIGMRLAYRTPRADRQVPKPGTRCPACRALQGTCAAHWAAVKAALAAGGASLLRSANPMELASLIHSLPFCANYGPRAVASSTDLLALSEQLLRSLPAGLSEVRGGKGAGWVGVSDHVCAW